MPPLHACVEGRLRLPIFVGGTVCLAAYFGAPCAQVRVSALHRDVSRALAERGCGHVIEHLPPDRLFSIDIALPGGGA